MQKAKNVILVLLLFSAFGACSYGLFLAFRAFVSGILDLNPNIAAATVAASATVIVSVVTVVYNQRKNKERDISESHRPKKIDVYKRFMDEAVLQVIRLSSEKEKNAITDKDVQKELQEFFYQFTGDIIVWGSPKAIKEYTKFRESAADKNIILNLDDMLRAMREDLGNSNRGLERGALIRLFLTDPEKLSELIKADGAA